jgi:2-dehydropantoate 2-reductase
MKSSMLMDLERGNRLELEWLSGAVCRLGDETGVETPVHCVVRAALAPFADGQPESSRD